MRLLRRQRIIAERGGLQIAIQQMQKSSAA
jgi:hypothetical protein